MQRNCCASTIFVSELLVRATLSYFDKAQILKKFYYLPGFEGGCMAHGSLNNYLLSANKFCLHYWQAILQQHSYDFTQICIEFFQCFAL